MQAIRFGYQLICLTSDAAKVRRVIRPAAKGRNFFSRGGQSKKKETKELNMDYGNKNKVYMFRLAILRSQSFGWQFCKAHCLEWQIANFLLLCACEQESLCPPEYRSLEI